jgi:hypothetical protein
MSLQFVVWPLPLLNLRVKVSSLIPVRALIPFYSKERTTLKAILLLPLIRRPPLLRRPSGRRCEEGSPAPRRVDLYSFSFLLLPCSSPCLGLGLLLLISGGGGGLDAFSDGSKEPFGPPPRCGVRWERDIGMPFFIVLSTSWRTHGIDSCGDSKAWSYSLVSAGGLLPGFNARRFFDMDRSGGERRRPVSFSSHGVAFFVICVISRYLS